MLKVALTHLGTDYEVVWTGDTFKLQDPLVVPTPGSRMRRTRSGLRREGQEEGEGTSLGDEATNRRVDLRRVPLPGKDGRGARSRTRGSCPVLPCRPICPVVRVTHPPSYSRGGTGVTLPPGVSKSDS